MAIRNRIPTPLLTRREVAHLVCALNNRIPRRELQTQWRAIDEQLATSPARALVDDRARVYGLTDVALARLADWLQRRGVTLGAVEQFLRAHGRALRDASSAGGDGKAVWISGEAITLGNVSAARFVSPLLCRRLADLNRGVPAVWKELRKRRAASRRGVGPGRRPRAS
jgi:DNA-binding transcriptional MerR regulator